MGYQIPPDEKWPIVTPGVDIPGDNPIHVSPPRKKRKGVIGSTLAAIAALLVKIKSIIAIAEILPVAKTLITMAISLGVYTFFFGPLFALALVVMIFFHEMGHVVAAKAEGVKSSSPLFIPMLGAVILQKQMPKDAFSEAKIAIAGPMSGALFSALALFLYQLTHSQFMLLAAYIGFLINLFNLIPVSPMDGGRVLGMLSKWFQLVGLLIVLALIFTGQFSPLLILIFVVGLMQMMVRFRRPNPDYYNVEPWSRWVIGLLYVSLMAFLGWGMYLTDSILRVSILR